MTDEHTLIENQYYIGPERRRAQQPRRRNDERRHRNRDETLLSDCRTGEARRHEDEEGFIEIANLYNEAIDHPQKKK